MNAATCTILQNALHAESRSFLQYVSDAFPWTSPDELTVLSKVQALITEELEGVQTLGHVLAQARQPLPYLGSYPMSFTTMNFVSLDHLLPILIREERRSLANREQDLARVRDVDAQVALRGIIDMKRRHLQTLEEMAATHSPSSASVRSSA